MLITLTDQGAAGILVLGQATSLGKQGHPERGKEDCWSSERCPYPPYLEQPGHGLWATCIAGPHESYPVPRGQSCPKINLRPGGAGTREEICSGPGVSAKEPLDQSTSP